MKDRFQKILDNAIIAWVVGILALVIFCMFTTSCSSATASQLADSIIVYNEYYKATEKLLTEIDKDYDWSTSYADSGKEENFGYYHIQYILRDTKGMTIAETYKTLKSYYQESQILLDELENDYNWLDTTGEGDTYCEWCEILKKIEQ